MQAFFDLIWKFDRHHKIIYTATTCKNNSPSKGGGKRRDWSLARRRIGLKTNAFEWAWHLLADFF